MTVDRQYGRIVFVCDYCDATFDDPHHSSGFDVALIEAKDQGWKVRKVAGQWLHACPDCEHDA